MFISQPVFSSILRRTPPQHTLLYPPHVSSSLSRKPSAQTYSPQVSSSLSRKPSAQTYSPHVSSSLSRKPSAQTYSPQVSSSLSRKPSAQTYSPHVSSSLSKKPSAQTHFCLPASPRHCMLRSVQSESDWQPLAGPQNTQHGYRQCLRVGDLGGGEGGQIGGW